MVLVETEKNFPTTRPVTIPLQGGRYCIVNEDWLKPLSKFHFYAKKSRDKWYACCKIKKSGKVSFLRMHRMVAFTPPDMVCHHINGNTLDNRRENLLNMTHYDHAKMFSYW